MWLKRITVAVIVLTVLLIITVLAPMVEQARESARRTQSKNNLKQIGLALYNYESTYGGYPMGGVFDVERRGYHGWISMSLPFIDASPLYNSINFKQPWDSSENAGTFLNTQPTFENPSELQVPSRSEFPLAHYSANPHVLGINSYTKVKSIENSDQVFMAGELGGDFLPWGCAYNWRPLAGLNSKPATYGRPTRDGCQFLFVDGKVKFISNDVSSEVLEQMRGDDLTGFANDSHLFPRPLAFPVPADALRTAWERFNGAGFVVIKRDLRGNVVTIKPNDEDPWKATDSDFQLIEKFSHLRVLVAEGDFSDAGIKLLSKLQKIQDLSLRSNKITVSGLSFVGSLPALKTLWVKGAQITDEDVTRLKEQLPTCEVR